MRCVLMCYGEENHMSYYRLAFRIIQEAQNCDVILIELEGDCWTRRLPLPFNADAPSTKHGLGLNFL
jgi:hypothetical protein